MDFRWICARIVVVMQVLELMKTHVTTTRPESTLGEAVDLMDLYQVPCLPVVDATKRLCGILMDDDVLRAMTEEAQGAAEAGAAMSEADLNRALAANHAAHLLVQDFMLRPAISISEHCDARQAARLLLTHAVECLPVTDDLERVVGTVSRVDIIQAVFEQLL